jgi:hypothetical protein
MSVDLPWPQAQAARSFVLEKLHVCCFFVLEKVQFFVYQLLCVAIM